MNLKGTIMRCRNFVRISMCCVLVMGFTTVAAAENWKPQVVRQLNGAAAAIRIPAKLQIVTEQWNRVVAVPYLVHMPEKDRLLMSVACDYPHVAMLLSSEDRGATWSKPWYLHVDGQGNPDAGMCTGLTYLGDGKLMATSGSTRWLSTDCGKTWSSVPIKGEPLYGWDPIFVDKDPNTGKIVRLLETAYTERAGNSQGYIRFSADEGHTWTEALKVPEWQGINEVALVRAGNGDLVGACRTDLPEKFINEIDHYSGLGVSISKDNGQTWSKLNMLYQWGRHHPSTVLLPNGELVMTYVVRAGYVRTAGGFPQFGIEAVVSHDHGQTWDLDHRYLLHTWQGNRNSSTKEWGGPQQWWASSQATSSVLFPEGTILTAFGTGYRSEPTQAPNQPAPRDIGLVQWRVGDQPLNDDRTLRDAPFDSDLRNVVDPATDSKIVVPEIPGLDVKLGQTVLIQPGSFGPGSSGALERVPRGVPRTSYITLGHSKPIPFRFPRLWPNFSP